MTTRQLSANNSSASFRVFSGNPLICLICGFTVDKYDSVLDNFGSALDKNGYVLDNFGACSDNLWSIKTPKNRLASPKTHIKAIYKKIRSLSYTKLMAIHVNTRQKIYTHRQSRFILTDGSRNVILFRLKQGLIRNYSMESFFPIALRIIAAVALIYFGLGLFNVPWLLRIRILISLATGALIVGAVGYRFVRPADPLGAISLFTGEITPADALIMIGLGFAAGAVATLLCYPLGSILAPYAAPAGIAVLALASGSIKQLLITHSELTPRTELYSFMRWEALLWLGICAAGYTAVLLTSKLLRTKAVTVEPQPENAKKSAMWINAVIGSVIAAVIVKFAIGIFAQNIPALDENLGSVIGRPGNGQIAFGIFISVGLAAFLVKRFLHVHFIPVILAAVVLYIVLLTQFIGSETMDYMVKKWNPSFFTNAIYAIIPIQIAAFSALGAMTGYWIAIRTAQPSTDE